MVFKLVSKFSPCGDQVDAIKKIVEGFNGSDCCNGHKHKQEQTLLGVTGSGKTFTMANVISKLQKKTLILAHNKTLAAQLFSEFRDFFPHNAVEYFVSYYDYYRPEAYVPGTDTYIEKDAAINDQIDKLRHSATRSLLERNDVIVVASVSCIYGIGSPAEYAKQRVQIIVGDKIERDQLLKKFVAIQYERNEIDFYRGHFRVRGDLVEIFPPYEESNVIRIEFFDDEIQSISIVDPLRGRVLERLNDVVVYPKSHYVVGENKLEVAIKNIKEELRERLIFLENEKLLVEKQRLEQRTMLDLEMLEEMGYCSGIENYSRHLTGALPGDPPPTLVDYFGDDYLLIIDESHMTIPQIGAMYRGDRARKENLVNFGFRLPSALDNRPLKFEEFEKRKNLVLYVSATPSEYELNKSGGEFVEQIIRPTGLLDPVVEIRDAENQVDDLLEEIKRSVKNNHKVLVTTLTKRLAEEITSYYQSIGIRVRYLHSDIDTIERVEIIKDLRSNVFDVLVGINLLREGLDIPEVALVAIMDADKEGFLRSERSLIQTIGRSARNVDGRVIMYAYKVTASMQKAVNETERRRKIQQKYNFDNKITPETIKKEISAGVLDVLKKQVEKNANSKDSNSKKNSAKSSSESSTSCPGGIERYSDFSQENLDKEIVKLTNEMKEASRNLDFEKAIKLRDEIRLLKEASLFLN